MIMAASGQSVFQSDADVQYADVPSVWAAGAAGPGGAADAAVVGIGVVRDWAWSLGMLGAFVYHWSLDSAGRHHYSVVLRNFLPETFFDRGDNARASAALSGA